MEALSGTHNDLARLVYSMYKTSLLLELKVQQFLPIQEP
jgi:hypothetical protein